jgi:hypothetical protein
MVMEQESVLLGFWAKPFCNEGEDCFGGEGNGG